VNSRLEIVSAYRRMGVSAYAEWQVPDKAGEVSARAQALFQVKPA
jgi:hypothetical protein